MKTWKVLRTVAKMHNRYIHVLLCVERVLHSIEKKYPNNRTIEKMFNAMAHKVDKELNFERELILKIFDLREKEENK